MKKSTDSRPRAIGYTRVSTARQSGPDRWSLPAQRRALQELADREGWDLVDVLEDAGISGKTLDARPAMLAALDRVAAGEVDFLAAVEFERFSRGRGRDWDRILDACEQGGAQLVTPGQRLDPTAADDMFLGDVFAAVARRERRRIVERAKRGLRERARAGKWSGASPFGFTIGGDGRLAPVPEQADVIRRIFEMRLAGGTYLGISNDLTEQGVPTPGNGRRWWPDSVRQLLLRAEYAGDLTYGSGRPGRPVSPDGVTEVRDAHEAIVDRVTWDAVQAMGAAYRPTGRPANWVNSDYWLSGGTLICPFCGRAGMSGSATKGRRGERVRYYTCNGRLRRAPNRCRKLRADAVESAVLDRIAEALDRPDVVERVRRELVETRLRGATSETKRRADLVAELEQEERKARTLYEDRVSGVLTAGQFREWNEDSLARQQQIRDDLRALEDRLTSIGMHHDVEALVAAIQDLPTVLDALEPQERKILMADLLRRVELTAPLTEGGEVRVVFRLPGLAPEADPLDVPAEPDAQDDDGAEDLRARA